MNLSMNGRPPVSTQQQLKRNRQTKKRAEALAKRFGTQILKDDWAHLWCVDILWEMANRLDELASLVQKEPLNESASRDAGHPDRSHQCKGRVSERV